MTIYYCAAQQIYNAHTVPLSPYNSQLLGTALQLLILMFSSSSSFSSSPYKNTNWWWFHSIVRCYTLEKTLSLSTIFYWHGKQSNDMALLTIPTLIQIFFAFPSRKWNVFLRIITTLYYYYYFLSWDFFSFFPNSFSFQPLNELQWRPPVVFSEENFRSWMTH